MKSVNCGTTPQRMWGWCSVGITSMWYSFIIFVLAFYLFNIFLGCSITCSEETWDEFDYGSVDSWIYTVYQVLSDLLIRKYEGICIILDFRVIFLKGVRTKKCIERIIAKAVACNQWFMILPWSSGLQLLNVIASPHTV